jgi:WD40 repeat protein
LFTFATSNGPARSVSFSADGTRLRIATPDSASIWDSQTGQFLAHLTPTSSPDRGSPDPQRVEVADAPEKVPTPSTPSRAAAPESRGPGKFQRLALDPTSTLLATIDGRSKVQLWGAETGTLRHTLDGRFSAAARLFFSPNGRRLLVADPSAALSTVWNTATGREVTSLLTRVDSATFNADGSRVATVSGDHVARVWSASSGREILALKGHAAIVRFIAFSPDSRFITTASEDGAVKLWRAELGREYNKTGSVIEGLDFSPDGKRLAVAHDEHIATVWSKAGDTSSVSKATCTAWEELTSARTANASSPPAMTRLCGFGTPPRENCN